MDIGMSDLPAWPSDLAAYKRTPEFSETTVPAALLRNHATKNGVWARLHVLDGRLRFVDQEGAGELILDPGVHDVIFPGRLHHVAPIGQVRFFVEFYRLSEEAAADPDADAGSAFPHR